MAIKTCAACGKEFEGWGRARYCSDPHFKHCVVCGKKFEYNPRLQQEPKVCSHVCAGKFVRQSVVYRIRICEQCGKSFQPTAAIQKFCSPECRTKSYQK